MSCEGGALVYVTVCYAVCHMESWVVSHSLTSLEKGGGREPI